MKVKLAKYVASLLVKNGISQAFSVTGGGAMHLNDGLGHEPGLKTLYMHHEQSCAMAAESYARIYNKPACLCVTSGPGGTNAITGVVGAWTDSIPMIVLSGQVRYDNTARWSETGIRVMGDQEFDIVRAVGCMTKYAKMITDPLSIRREVEKCLWLSQTGRPGPCWLDIPVDIQGTYIETNELEGFDRAAYEEERQQMLTRLREAEEKAGEGKRPGQKPGENEELLQVLREKQLWQAPEEMIDKDSAVIAEVIQRIRTASRPVFYTGNGLHVAGAWDLFLKVADRLGIPVAVGWNGQDILPSGHPLKCGQPGGRGDRPGNFAVQNADLILSAGSRLSIRQVGYNFDSWAREAFTIVCDIDEEELKKPSVHIDLPVHADARIFLKALDEKLEEMGIRGHGSMYRDSVALAQEGYPKGDPRFLFDGGKGLGDRSWRATCAWWMQRYPVYVDKFAAHGEDEPADMYEFYYRLSQALDKDTVTVVGNGSADVAAGQIYVIKDGTRFISQSGIASMGYDLPAAIGAACATHDISRRALTPKELSEANRQETRSRDDQFIADKAFALGELESGMRNPCWTGRKEHFPAWYGHDVICVTGDGSIMMNLQELQTIVSHRMPVKIFMVNNAGYHSIRQTQQGLFRGEPLVGIGEDSGDLSFPEFERLCKAFDLPFFKAEHNSGLDDAIRETLKVQGPAFCEIVTSMEQGFEPKSAVRKHPDGSLSSPPLEDLAPFLGNEEMDENMIISRWPE